MALVTVAAIVPTFRRPALLARALASICGQTRPPDRVVVVNDDPGGEDRTREVVAAAGLKDASVVTNGGAAGASGARNSGARSVACDVLAFLDDDDEWLPSYLETALRVFEEGDVDVVCVDFVQCDPQGVARPGKTAPEQLECGAFLTRNPGMVGSNILCGRLLYHEMGGFDESLPTHNDIDFGLRLSLRPALGYRPLHRPLIRRHEHSGQRLSTARSAAKREGIRRFYELHAHRMSRAQRREFRARSLQLWGIDERGGLEPGSTRTSGAVAPPARSGPDGSV